MGVEVSLVVMEIKNGEEVACEIGRTTGYRGDINIMNVDRDIIDGGCDGKVLSDRV